MSGLVRTSADFNDRCKRILFRAWHRGMREMDLIMGRFAEENLDKMSDEELDTFELLIEAQDRDVLAWITNEKETPSNYDTPVFQSLKAFHNHTKPIHV
jgi:antitoxin CptB